MDAIVVGTDGSPGAQAAVRKVIELLEGKGATVNLVCAYPARSALERIGMTARTESVDLRGVAADVLAAMIVVGARGNTESRRFHVGSVAVKLAHHARTSVLIVHE